MPHTFDNPQFNPQSNSPSMGSSPGGSSPSVGRLSRILVVDDSAVMRSLLRTVVSSDPRLEVVGTASDGASALKSLDSLKPDLILLDVEMPVMDGLKTLKRIKALGHRIPVIMCSALTQRGAQVTIEALANGAADYVAKPSGHASREAATEALTHDLIPKIHAWITASSPLRGQALQVQGSQVQGSQVQGSQLQNSQGQTSQGQSPQSQNSQVQGAQGPHLQGPHAGPASGPGSTHTPPSSYHSSGQLLPYQHPSSSSNAAGNTASNTGGNLGGNLGIGDAAARVQAHGIGGGSAGGLPGNDRLSRLLIPNAVTSRVASVAAGKVPPAVLLIGVSTGGPVALDVLLPMLPANFPLPVLVVQHMPTLFTKLLAERLDTRCPLRVSEASQDEVVRPGRISIAKGDWHMALVASGSETRIRLNQDPLENHCRPAVDVLFRSAAGIYGAAILAVILTGMGSDGLIGCRLIREQGGTVFAQDQQTSAIWGMPGAVAQAGLAHRVLPLNQIAPEILRLTSLGQRTSHAQREASELRESAV